MLIDLVQFKTSRDNEWLKLRYKILNSKMIIYACFVIVSPLKNCFF